MRVVCDTSPLLFLAKISRLSLLSQLYADILVPASVLDEIAVKPDHEAAWIRELIGRQIFRREQATPQFLVELPVGLGAGEREALALAVEVSADLVIIDDYQGRQLARSRGLTVTGTLGVLAEARARHLISSVRHELQHLTEAGLWIDETVYHQILDACGEETET